MADLYEDGGIYDMSLKNALEKQYPGTIDEVVQMRSAGGAWYVEVLWSDGEPDDPVLGHKWIQSWAHHKASTNLGYQTLADAHAFASGDPSLREYLFDQDEAVHGMIFRVRYVYSEDGPPKDTVSYVQAWDLGVHI